MCSNIKTIPTLTPARDVSHLPIVTYEQVIAEHPEHVTLMSFLFVALSQCRAGDSATEASFVASLAKDLKPDLIDAAGNLHFDRRLRKDGTMSRTMFTSHTDTVHRVGGHQDIVQDGKLWQVGQGGYCLGADDGSGLALLAHMMVNEVPGYYVMFRGEESGGIGSTWAAKNMPELFEDFDRAIAFDRADQSDVITYQSGGRCCSEVFAEALSAELSSYYDDVMYMPCDGGVYTDTAEFTGIIPECTNLSVGYKHQHGSREYQDIVFLKKLADIVVMIDWDELPTVRDPKVRESKYPSRYGGTSLYGSGGYGGYNGWPGMNASLHSDLDWDDGSNVTDVNAVRYAHGTVVGDDTSESESADAWDAAFAALTTATDEKNPGPLMRLLSVAIADEYQGTKDAPEAGFEASAFELALLRAWPRDVEDALDVVVTMEQDLFTASSVHDWACDWAEHMLSK